METVGLVGRRLVGDYYPPLRWIVHSFSRMPRMKKLQVCLWIIALVVMISMQQDRFYLSDRPYNLQLKKDNIETNNNNNNNNNNNIGRNPPSTTILRPPPLPSPPTLKPTTTIKPPPPTSGGGGTSFPPHVSISSPSTTTTTNFTIQMAPDMYQGKSILELPTMAQTFLQTHCDLHHVKEWYPTTPSRGSQTTTTTTTTMRMIPSWKQRAPYVIVAGVWNAGISSLEHALHQHPQMTAKYTMSLSDFFLPRTFYRYMSPSQKRTSSTGITTTTTSSDPKRTTTTTTIVKVFAARERMYAQVYPKFKAMATSPGDPPTDEKGGVVASSLSSSSASFLLAMDVSPGYLFHAGQTMTSIQCVCPWSKFVVLLRDPVERVYRQWVYGRVFLGLTLSFDAWIAQEFQAMESAGLFGTGTTEENDSHTAGPAARSRTRKGRRQLMMISPEEERKAWKRYQSKRVPASGIGRSMYVLQLEEWFDVLRSVGKEPSKEVFMIRSEVWETHPEEEYQQLLKFLGLAPHAPSNYSVPKTPDPLRHEPMNAKTRQDLQEFFEPYNQRLATMLQQQGFNEDGDWNLPLWL